MYGGKALESVERQNEGFIAFLAEIQIRVFHIAILYQGFCGNNSLDALIVEQVVLDITLGAQGIVNSGTVLNAVGDRNHL